MAVPVEEGVLSALRGVVSETTRLPKPLLIKVYVSSLKDEFREERRMILEMIGPELQALYDDRQVEIELIDMHFGTGPDDISMVELNPCIMDDYLYEIERCDKDSKSIFFIALVGEYIGKPVLPSSIPANVFQAICEKGDAVELELLRKWYKQTSGDGHDGDREFTLCNLYSNGRNQSSEDRLRDYRKILELIERSSEELLRVPSSDQGFIECLKAIRRTQIEMEIEKALDLAPDRIIAVFREWSNHISSPSVSSSSRERLRQLKDRLTLSLPSENYSTLIVPGKSSNRTIDTDSEDHEIYLSKFKNKLLNKMSNSIEQSLTNDPDVIKGRKKTVQEIFHEHSTHLRFLNEHLNSKSLISSSIPERLRNSIMLHFKNGSRHAPFFIHGGHGTGKSTLIAELYSKVPDWFGYSKVHRVIRFASATPRSGYNLELLRVICQQISIIFNIPEGYLPKDASFDPLYINNWFQTLQKRCEDLNNEVLFLFIDDLHKLNPLDCDNVAALSWLPISLPWNVFIVCSTTIPIDQLKLTPIQKDRFKSGEFLFDLSQDINKTELKMLDNNVPFTELVEQTFNELEEKYGRKGIGRFASYMTCTEFGLTETELLELLMPTENYDAMIDTSEGNFNFSTFRRIRNEMKFLLREKIMSGKILIEWRHRICAEIAKSRYMDTNSTRMMHTEIANIFFNQLSEESDETSTEETVSEDSQKLKDEKSSPKAQDDTSTLFNPPGADVSYSIRHVEESWHHLMRSDDTGKFKQIAVCNFDFLLASVQTVSISYLRCLIEHVRCYILDRDIELIYYTIRKSSDVLTRDPMQLGAQLISWLRPINEHDENDNSLLSITVRSATAWCDGYTVPLLVPMTGWLPVPLPSQIRTMTVSGTGPIRDIALAPSKQHLVIATKVGDAQLWHIMSNSLVHTFKGHTAPVTSMVVPPGSNMLVTGSEDASIIVWNVNNRSLKAHIREHIAPVLCVTCAMNNTLAISGGEDSRIIIMDLNMGKVLGKIDHHRGPVTSVQVSASSDVLVSASHDATICLWSLEDYSLLNCIQMHSPIFTMRISCDSVFLLGHCADNGLYLRTLATGTELHALKGHKSKVRTMAIAMDSQRAIIGCDDTRALIFDMHSGRLVRSLPPNPGPCTALYVLENDDFLITVGGNKITFYSFRNEEVFVNPYSHRRRKKHSKPILSQRSTNPANIPPVTCFDISRDSQLAAVASSKSVHIMQINSPELQCTLDGHTGAVTCVNFSPNCEFLTSGSEDKTVVVWNLGLALASITFKGHNAGINCVVVLMDSRRVISSDKEGTLHVWLADSATLLQTVQGPNKFLAATNNMKFAVCTNGDNSLKIWSLTREDEKYTVSHSGEITCFAITADSLYVITGSRDMSLKVWQATGGKLAQVLVGHIDAVTCVAVSVTNKSQVISGSKDCNLIVWDIHTGEEIHTLAGHLAQVTCVKVSADGTTAVSGSDDKTLIVWEIKRGLALTSLQIHMPFIRFDISLECSRILVQLVDSFNLPVICLHNTPASYVKLPTYSAPALDADDLRPAGPKRQMKRLLKKEVSLDTYTWQKKYGHLTSSVMMAQVDERLKRRFSVSASMEEISKIAEMKSLASQTSLGPEQAALAQSQHFDQLEALWNKRSPPRRRHNTTLSRQSSLVEDRIESSDEDEFQEERTGVLF
ncbi:NACHT domain- and WD repeat-containing protein 1 isoform X3 [Hermetia illucens]|uniref:NACHT domain- and WD repeat-containing protein 1 isoform X3 n=1 Tax=Hermetia illucens TaxID=343691 RepID=UPI0018CC6DEA|nr:NACHT domain- and WD repeat-containing protein 1 isoform X3 [Hermetia illucens]